MCNDAKKVLKAEEENLDKNPDNDTSYRPELKALIPILDKTLLENVR